MTDAEKESFLSELQCKHSGVFVLALSEIAKNRKICKVEARAADESVVSPHYVIKIGENVYVDAGGVKREHDLKNKIWKTPIHDMSIIEITSEQLRSEVRCDESTLKKAQGLIINGDIEYSLW